uniref:SH2 domain-containing adapter protein D n=1 Tax=Culicoides sonorensis TaxID=179676 RepID=A0A336JY69_CULSO
MEKVWRKVNQGLASNKNNKYKTDTTDSAAGFGEETNVVAIAEQKLKKQNNTYKIVNLPERSSTKPKRRKKLNTRKKPSESEEIHTDINGPSLREKAVARLKLFNFNLRDLQMSQCTPCGSKAGNIITRRLYRSKRQNTDNELYRSNKSSISVCDDYSLPIDFLKKRPSSFDPSLTNRLLNEWNTSGILTHQSDQHKSKVKFIEGYSQPRDSKAIFESENSSQPKSSENVSDAEEDSQDSLNSNAPLDLKNSEKLKSSPYYYSDLAKGKSITSKPSIVKKSIPAPKKKEKLKQIGNTSKKSIQNNKKGKAKKNSRFKEDFNAIERQFCTSSGSLTSEDSNCSECKIRRNWHAKALANVLATCNISSNPNILKLDNLQNTNTIILSRNIFGKEPNDTLGSSTSSVNDNSEQAINTDEMNNSVKKVYETAFDSIIAPKNDDPCAIDNITKNPTLFPFPSDQLFVSTHEEIYPKQINKVSFNQSEENILIEKDILTNKIQTLRIKEDTIEPCCMRNHETPPSTAPLPLKFPLKSEEIFRTSVQSTPNIPDLRRFQYCIDETQKGPQASSNYVEETRCKKYDESDRPHSVIGIRRLNQLKCVQDIRKRKFKNYLSTESMRSSNNSIDSIHSSISDGARSTSSSDSRQSSSISSHESDSGTNILFQSKKQLYFNAKLQILSPISDKSVQDPDVDLMKNRDSKNPCAQASLSTESEFIQYDNIPKQNITFSKKVLSSLATQEIRGSDSGISLQSREDSKSKLVYKKTDEPPDETGLPHGLKDLPFDMPKLRRRRTSPKNIINTSGSATSVDLGELPFDMPKLLQHPEQSGYDSNDVDVNALKMSKSVSKPLKFGTLDGQTSSKSKMLNLGLNKYTASGQTIDVSIPFDRQNWYHGSISRIDAENILRSLNEGSFLVRNSESTKQDYSLSLKSAKGFMHMRIQKIKDTNMYVLGQFSRPFDSIPEMIQHFCLNRLPVRGAEHMCLVEPVIVQIL